MLKSESMIALIAVKGNSERIRKKNTRPFHNTNLLELKLNQITKVKNIDKIIVSSEDNKCLDIARKFGVGIHERNPRYSTSSVPMSKVYSYLASECSGDNIIWIPVTNPLIDTHVYEDAIEIYKKMDKKYDCLLSGVELKDYIFLNKKPIGFKPNPWPRSQDLTGLSMINFAINILKRKNMVNWGSLVGDNPFFYYLNRLDSWDIDFQEDFDFCEMIYKNRSK